MARYYVSNMVVENSQEAQRTAAKLRSEDTMSEMFSSMGVGVKPIVVNEWVAGYKICGLPDDVRPFKAFLKGMVKHVKGISRLDDSLLDATAHAPAEVAFGGNGLSTGRIFVIADGVLRDGVLREGVLGCRPSPDFTPGPDTKIDAVFNFENGGIYVTEP